MGGKAMRKVALGGAVLVCFVVMWVGVDWFVHWGAAGRGCPVGLLVGSEGEHLVLLDGRTGRKRILPTWVLPVEGEWRWGRPYHLRGRNQVLSMVEDGEGKRWLCRFDTRWYLLSCVEAPAGGVWFAVSPDEEWLVVEGTGRGGGLWVGRLEEPGRGWKLSEGDVDGRSIVWCGEWIYFTRWVSGGEGVENVRVRWRGGEEELTGWRGRILGVAGHDPEGVLVAEREGVGERVYEWRRGRPLGELELVWDASHVGAGAAWVGPGEWIVTGVDWWFWKVSRGAFPLMRAGRSWLFVVRVGGKGGSLLRGREGRGLDWIPPEYAGSPGGWDELLEGARPWEPPRHRLR